ncbi:M20 family metallopeptidase [Enterococcus sp. 2201sp1_2201st1_B8_2201SCRN_220225]|uniref:M20 metallopeptidase family protein n=1 Tax=unclassified Enterococcus TaxID=2608891 RepID=UPI0034A3630B
MQITKEVTALLPQVKRWRRDLHQIPELGLEEYETCAYLKKELKKMGIRDSEVYQPLETCLLVVLEGKNPGKTLAFRTDIDGLPVTEATGVDFASKNPGRMHACGHDGHMATMLGFANYLVTYREQLCGRVILIFQPAEEGPGGAQLLLDTGILQELGVEQIIGLHLFPEFPAGVIAARVGGMMARNGEVTIKITGLSAHGAQPQQGHDAILAMSGVIQGLHSIISRNLSPLESAVLTFGKITGGEAMNIIPGEVTLEGTMRAFSDEVYETMVERIQSVAQNVAAGYGCTAEVQFNHMYRVVNNDASMVAALEKVAKESYVTTPPYLLAEDFSMYQQVFPGLFFFVGIRDEEKGYIHPLHSNKMQFDEKNLLGGIQCYLGLLAELNKGADL